MDVIPERSAGAASAAKTEPLSARYAVATRKTHEDENAKLKMLLAETMLDNAILNHVAAERRRFGYQAFHVMVERQGIVMNLKKLRRLY